MRDVAKSFPHPVLGLGDDIDGLFYVKINVNRNSETQNIDFNVVATIKNAYIGSLISEGKAGILIKVYCASTFKTWSFLNENIFSIPEGELVNKIDIEPLVIALKNIDEYYDSSFNEEFGNRKFMIEQNDIIGFLKKVTLPIDKKYERLNIGNIFSFSPEDSSEPVHFDFSSDKIIIHYPVTSSGVHPHNELFQLYPWTAFNILILPAVTEAFRLMANSESRTEIEDNEWYFALNQAIPEGDRNSDPYVTAQMLLENEIPLHKSYQELSKSKSQI